MRLRVTYVGEVLPCGYAGWGEVEDYTLNVIEPVGIYPGNVSCDPTFSCGTDPVTLTLANWNGDALQWQSSPDGNIWNDIVDLHAPYKTYEVQVFEKIGAF